jgi:adenosylhomocysteinase
MAEAARVGDIFVTVTGDKDIIGPNHMSVMKDGAIVCNSGHFDVEIDLPALRKLARRVDRYAEREVEIFHLRNGRKLYLLGQGRLVNLACAGGHPAQVMDMSFATQAMAAAWASGAQLEVKVHNVPLKIEDEVAAMKLAAMGIKIDRLSAEQKQYLASWQSGT